MSVKIDKGQALQGINLTPMIDCVFLLLIFFLVATRFEEAEREMNVILPQASAAAPLTVKPKQLIVNVDQQGSFFIAGQKLNEEELYQTLRQAAADNPGRQAVEIRADRRCRWEFVADVMNACNKAHIRDYVVRTASE
jgi:biopolymer transport protein ExbD